MPLYFAAYLTKARTRGLVGWRFIIGGILAEEFAVTVFCIYKTNQKKERVNG
jgi:hypothetical protein